MDKGKAIAQESSELNEVGGPLMTPLWGQRTLEKGSSSRDSGHEKRNLTRRSMSTKQCSDGPMNVLNDTPSFGTSGSKSTSTTYSIQEKACSNECVINIGCGSDGNTGDETLQSPASPEPSRLWIKITNCALSSNINWLLHHLRELRQTDNSWPKVLAGILVQASASIIVNNGSSSVFTKIAVAVAFSASLAALSLRNDRGEAVPRYLVKLGAIAYASVMFEPIVNNLPASTMGVVTVAFLIAVAAVINT